MHPIRGKVASGLGENPHQLELTAQFLEELASQVLSKEERQLCRSEARQFRLEARRHRKQTGGLILKNTIAVQAEPSPRK